MTKKTRWLMAGSVAAAATLLVGSMAFADDSVDPGDYSVAVPGAGSVQVRVDGGGRATLVSLPAGLAAAPNAATSGQSDEVEFRLRAAGGEEFKIKVEDGRFVVENEGVEDRTSTSAPGSTVGDDRTSTSMGDSTSTTLDDDTTSTTIDDSTSTTIDDSTSTTLDDDTTSTTIDDSTSTTVDDDDDDDDGGNSGSGKGSGG